MDIKDYSDYRQFIIEFFEIKKKLYPAWSWGAWTKHLGLKSTSSLTKVINGEREMGRRMAETLKNYFEFSSEDTNYFYALIENSKKSKKNKLVYESTTVLKKKSLHEGIFYNKLMDKIHQVFKQESDKEYVLKIAVYEALLDLAPKEME